MHLTVTAIRKIKPREKPVKMFDERGLFLLVTKMNVEAPLFERGGSVQPAGGRSRL